MTKLINISRLAKPTAVLSSSAALMSSAVIANAKGSPGTITVSNGTNSVTMPGGSLNLSGATSVQAAIQTAT